jgi:uncharacterized membrane protein required for colicin V production
MGKIDIAIIIITLLFLLIGFFKGFVKQLLSTANWLVALIGSFLLVKPVTSLLSGSLGQTINTKILDWISTKGEIFSLQMGTLEEGQFTSGLEALGLPGFIADIFSKLFVSGDLDASLTFGEALSRGIGNIVLTIILFVILFIILMIILKILTNILSNLFDSGVLGIVNKLLGGALGLVKAIVLISGAMLLASAIAGIIPSVQDFLTVDLNLGSTGFGIGKYIYENNPLLAILNGSFNFKDILNDLSYKNL